jgi:hypothetical protein
MYPEPNFGIAPAVLEFHNYNYSHYKIYSFLMKIISLLKAADFSGP